METKISPIRIPEKLKRDAIAKGKEEGFTSLTGLIIYLLTQFLTEKSR